MHFVQSTIKASNKFCQAIPLRLISFNDINQVGSLVRFEQLNSFR